MPREEVVDSREKKTDEPEFLEEAHKRFQAAADYEAENRRRAREDLAMLAGDQWPANVIADRNRDKRPMLTSNRLPTFTAQVIGDARQNRMAIKVRAQTLHETNGANKPEEIAETFNGMIRNIESASDGPAVYQSGFEGAANQGFGNFRVATEFSADDTFDQDIRLRPIHNAFSVYFDPRDESLDGSGAKWVFVSEMIPRREFKELYPNADEPSNWQDLADYVTAHWIDKDDVRIAEYWVKRPIDKKIVLLSDGRVVEESKWRQIQDDVALMEDAAGPVPTVVRERTVRSHVVLLYIIDGAQIIEGPRYDNGKFILDFKDEKDIRTEDGKYRDYVWSGKYIPIVPVWGKALIVDGKRILQSVVRHAHDMQRMLNYFLSAEAEGVALAKLPPVMMTPTQLGNHDALWRSKSNEPYVLVEPDPQAPGWPQLPQRPQASLGNMNLIGMSVDGLKSTMGMFDPSLGARSNETSGRAIIARQREGDVGTFPFHDNLRRAVEHTGRILVDLIPKIYDTERQMMVLNEQGDEGFVGINQVVRDKATGKDVILNDLSQGEYTVTVTAGPSFGTQRQEAVETLTSLAGSLNVPMAAEILVAAAIGNMDFPGAGDVTGALKKLLPPGMFDKEDEEQAQVRQQQGPSPEDQKTLAEVKTEEAKAAKLTSEVALTEAKTVQIQSETDEGVRQIAEAAVQGALGDADEGGGA